MLTHRMPLKVQFLLLCWMSCVSNLSAQEKPQWQFNGAWQAQFNYFIKDVKIGAANTPQYEDQHFGLDSWLNLNINYGAWRSGIRFDLFQNSNLLNPTGSYTDRGIGLWFIERDFQKIGIRIGSIYDQIGSGTIYRSYEERPLLIDNALLGARIKYQINDDWQFSAFGGKQKYLFSSNDGLLAGAKLEGFISAGKDNQYSYSPGLGLITKRLSEDSADKLVSVLRNYIGEERVKTFSYNSLALSAYNNFNYKSISWFLEMAYKLPEVFYDLNENTTKITGAKASGRYVQKSGTVLYSTLSYARKGLGITMEAKRTENFDFRIDPTLNLNNGLIGFLPPMNHITTYRLTSRYNPATQYTSELAFQIDLNLKLNKKYSLNINGANITSLNYELLYREIYLDLAFKPNKKFGSHWGIQRQWYNQAIYEGKPKSITPLLTTWTPYADIIYKITRKKSVKLEAQYMASKQDYGSWINILTEYAAAPHWRFELSGMYNIIPNSDNPNIPEGAGGQIFYPTLGVNYIKKQNRYSLRYVKQVEGVVCTGGVCRLEPAFSGVKFEINSRF